MINVLKINCGLLLTGNVGEERKAAMVERSVVELGTLDGLFGGVGAGFGRPDLWWLVHCVLLTPRQT